jgi:hypothetical protein
LRFTAGLHEDRKNDENHGSSPSSAGFSIDEWLSLMYVVERGFASDLDGSWSSDGIECGHGETAFSGCVDIIG